MKKIVFSIIAAVMLAMSAGAATVYADEQEEWETDQILIGDDSSEPEGEADISEPDDISEPEESSEQEDSSIQEDSSKQENNAQPAPQNTSNADPGQNTNPGTGKAVPISVTVAVIAVSAAVIAVVRKKSDK